MEFSFKYRFEAAHRFLHSASEQCQTPHGHTWYATLSLRSVCTQLNEHDMVIEFSQLKSFWKKLISETFDHSFLCNHNDPLIPTLLATHPKARLLLFPGDPTTELISVLLFCKMEKYILQSPLEKFVKVAAIQIDETPTNSLSCSPEFYRECITQYKKFSGWWTSLEVDARGLKTGS